MSLKIALAGNPNCGKTTLFNVLTGSNQFVGNWPGVTVEKKEGKLQNHEDIIITDLPGIYSLSPYTLEEVVARNYLVDERPDAILNIIDGTNIERNLYLTTQLTEIGIPVVIAINMMDIVRKNKDKIDIEGLSKKIGCKIVEISALKNDGIEEVITSAIEVAKSGKTLPKHHFSGVVEHALAHIEEATIHDMDKIQQRFYAIKIFERDYKVIEKLKLDESIISHIEEDIVNAEEELDDDAESIITNERYNYIASILKDTYKKRSNGVSNSEKIDKVLTNRFAALPIFAIIMFLIYYISVSSVGTFVTDWANDGVFGEGWHLLGIGSEEYEQDIDEFANKYIFTSSVKNTVDLAASKSITGANELKQAIEDKDFANFEENYDTYGESLASSGYDISKHIDKAMNSSELPESYEYGVWVPGVPVLVENGLDAINCATWLKSLIVDGIVAGVGAVLGFLPQMIILFILLAFLEACGYMSRIAFVLDKVFRKFGLSGKSFIPMLIGTGCGVPGIMSSRTIENERDRRMTIITTTFIPCGAKLPIIALIASALFDGAWWIAPSAYFIGIFAIVISGIILKKTSMFKGDPAPFVMELPAYHLPTFTNVMRSMWDRTSSFIKKAGSVILIASIVIWAGSRFGIVDGTFMFSNDMILENSILGKLGNTVAWIFTPLGFGNIKATIATLMGLLAKEEVVGVFGVLDFSGMGQLAAYSFLVFNLLCAPCFAAMGAIRREMNSFKWTSFAIGYQCLFAYATSLVIFQVGSALSGNMNIIGLLVSIGIIVYAMYMVFKPYKES